jgi:hypothetical protein
LWARQFRPAQQSAHYLPAAVYNALLSGKSIGEAMRDGRNAMEVVDAAKFFDWGIPVLYAKDSAASVFPLNAMRLPFAAPLYTAGDGNAFAGKTPGEGDTATEVVEDTLEGKEEASVKVALIDLVASVGFLPGLARDANFVQKYYYFEVAYLPVPAGYVRTDLGERPQTYIFRLEEYMRSIPTKLSVDFVCCLTRWEACLLRLLLVRVGI